MEDFKIKEELLENNYYEYKGNITQVLIKQEVECEFEECKKEEKQEDCNNLSCNKSELQDLDTLRNEEEFPCKINEKEDQEDDKLRKEITEHFECSDLSFKEGENNDIKESPNQNKLIHNIDSGDSNTQKQIHNKNNSIQYKCNECDYSSLRKGNLNKHNLLIHKKTNSLQYDHLNNLNTQIQIYNKKKSVLHKCDHCDYSSLRKGNLNKHNLLIHNKNNSLQYDHGSHLNKQIQIHNKEKSVIHKCDHCDYSSHRKGNVNQHKLIHNKDNAIQYKCNQCDYSTHHKGHLNTHMLIHNKEQAVQYKCSQCDYISNLRGNLRRHNMLTHNKDTAVRYECDQCSYSNHRKDKLKRHKLVHFSEVRVKVFTCDQCDYSSCRMDHLKQHLLIHNKEKPFKCDQCTYSAHRLDYLKKHLTTHKQYESESL